jgi:hypothetical protein
VDFQSNLRSKIRVAVQKPGQWMLGLIGPRHLACMEDASLGAGETWETWDWIRSILHHISKATDRWELILRKEQDWYRNCRRKTWKISEKASATRRTGGKHRRSWQKFKEIIDDGTWTSPGAAGKPDARSTVNISPRRDVLLLLSHYYAIDRCSLVFPFDSSFIPLFSLFMWIVSVAHQI